MNDISKQIARCVLQFGDSKVSTSNQKNMMLNEWLNAFQAYSPDHLHEAVSKSFQTCKWWPSIAEIMDHLKIIRREAIEVIDQLTGGKRWRGEEIEFAKNGRTEAEEIAKRVADCKRWKNEIGFQDEVKIDPVASWKPASQEMSVSHALKRTCAVRRSLGLETCGQNCQRQSCELREREENR